MESNETDQVKTEEESASKVDNIETNSKVESFLKVLNQIKSKTSKGIHWIHEKVKTLKKSKEIDPSITAEEGKIGEDGLVNVQPKPISSEEQLKDKDGNLILIDPLQELKETNEKENTDNANNKTSEEEKKKSPEDGEPIQEEHSKTYLQFVKQVEKISPKLANKLENYYFKLDPETSLMFEKYKSYLPKPPRSLIHASLLYDKYLTKFVPHWIRYFVYAGLWHVFPYWYGVIRGANLEGQCSEDLVPWMSVCASMSAGRIFGFGLLGAIRIRNRGWDGQNFGEAMGELINPLTDGADELDPCVISGGRLFVIRFLYHFTEFCWLCVGWTYYTNIQVCDDTIESAAFSLLMYQTFNLIVFSVMTDFVWPYCYMEWQRDIDVTTKFKKKPPKRLAPKRKVNKMDMMGMPTDDNGGDDDDDDDDKHKLKPQIILGPDGTPNVNPYAEKKDDDDDAQKKVSTTIEHSDKPKGESAAQKAAKQGAKETAKLWDQLGDPTADTAASLNKIKQNKQNKNLPNVSHAPLRRLGNARKKIAPEPGTSGGGEKKKLAAGSKGTEWWRTDGAAPPRKIKGKNNDSSSRPSTAPSQGEEGEDKGEDASKKEEKTTKPSKKTTSSPTKSPKPSKKTSPEKGAKKKVNTRPSTAPNLTNK